MAFLVKFLGYAFFALLATKLLVIHMRTSMLMLGWYWGDNVVGQYTDMLPILTLLDVPLKVNRQLISPYLAESFAAKRSSNLASFYRQTFYQQLLISGALLLLLFYNRLWLLPGALASTKIFFIK